MFFCLATEMKGPLFMLWHDILGQWQEERSLVQEIHWSKFWLLDEIDIYQGIHD